MSPVIYQFGKAHKRRILNHKQN